ncbi:MAG: putative transcriptional regulatory protein [Blastococcus sp.]|nr:putative transcriptional regulatory protein [Blastococcus sp.]
MGRTPGATAASTCQRLLRAAADVFARRGYEGTRVAEIAEAAGLSNGALYAYFGSKAELLVDALRAHGQRMLADLASADPTRSISDLLLQTGRSLHLQREPDDQLVIEALIAARRDEEVAAPMRAYVRERADWLAGLVQDAQERGELDPGIAPSAVAHFCLSLAAGTALVSPDLNDVDDEEWAALLARLLAALGPTHPTEEMGTAE